MKSGSSINETLRCHLLKILVCVAPGMFTNHKEDTNNK